MNRRPARTPPPEPPSDGRMLDLIDECHRIHGLVLVQRLAHEGMRDHEFLELDAWRALPLGLELLDEEIDRRFRAIAHIDLKKGGGR